MDIPLPTFVHAGENNICLACFRAYASLEMLYKRVEEEPFSKLAPFLSGHLIIEVWSEPPLNYLDPAKRLRLNNRLLRSYMYVLSVTSIYSQPLR